MEKQTGCDGIMLARGILGNPWLIKSLSNIYNNEEIEVTSKEKLHMILRHFELIEKYKGRRRAILEMRKHTGWYIKGMENAAKIRDRINKVKEKKEFEKILKELIV
jgi:tRNA-dihydrouridine synthase B